MRIIHNYFFRRSGTKSQQGPWSKGIGFGSLLSRHRPKDRPSSRFSKSEKSWARPVWGRGWSNSEFFRDYHIFTSGWTKRKEKNYHQKWKCLESKLFYMAGIIIYFMSMGKNITSWTPPRQKWMYHGQPGKFKIQLIAFIPKKTSRLGCDDITVQWRDRMYHPSAYKKGRLRGASRYISKWTNVLRWFHSFKTFSYFHMFHISITLCEYASLLTIKRFRLDAILFLCWKLSTTKPTMRRQVVSFLLNWSSCASQSYYIPLQCNNSYHLTVLL